MNFNLSKNIQILNYLAKKEGGKINYTKAIKLIFFSDKLYLRNYGKTITGDNYFALKYGPIPSSIFNIIKSPEEYNEQEIKKFIKIEGYDIISENDVDIDFFAIKEIEILNKIYDFFGNLDYSKIIDETHKYEEWKKHEHIACLGGSANMNLLDFFNNSTGQHEIFEMTEDNLELSKNIFIDSSYYE